MLWHISVAESSVPACVVCHHLLLFCSCSLPGQKDSSWIVLGFFGWLVEVFFVGLLDFVASDLISPSHQVTRSLWSKDNC